MTGRIVVGPLRNGEQCADRGGAGLPDDESGLGQRPHGVRGVPVVDRDAPVEAIARLRPGHATIDKVPQFMPAMIDSCGPGTVTGSPATSDR